MGYLVTREEISDELVEARLELEAILKELLEARYAVLREARDRRATRDMMSDGLVEYQCAKCRGYQTSPLDRCVECGHDILIRKTLSPLELQNQLRSHLEQMEDIWEELEGMNKAMAAMLDFMNSAKTNIMKLEYKLDAFLDAHGMTIEDDGNH